MAAFQPSRKGRSTWKPERSLHARTSQRRINGRPRTWFATDDAWREALAAAKEFIPRVTAFRGHLAESGETLLRFFRLDDEISLAFDPIVHYAQRRSDEDTRVAAYQEMVAQVTRFAVELQSAAAFETPELLAIDDETLNRLYAEAPELENYRLCIDRVRRRREHVLSDKEEAILAAAGEMAASPDDIYSMLNDADLKFPDAVAGTAKSIPSPTAPISRSCSPTTVSCASRRSTRSIRSTASSAIPRGDAVRAAQAAAVLCEGAQVSLDARCGA